MAVFVPGKAEGATCSCSTPTPDNDAGDKNSPGPIKNKFNEGLRLKKRHSALLVARLEQPNHASHALTGIFSGGNSTIFISVNRP